jgi:LmbE family N-acetylglucosaminyl deacetylase
MRSGQRVSGPGPKEAPVSDSEGSGFLFVSPHLDDAVLSCGRLLARLEGAAVVTALAGSPDRWDELTGWDAACGFVAGDNVMAARLSEDRAALGVLKARQRTVEGLDDQYGPQPGRAHLIRAGIESALAELEPHSCAIPLGLQHPDHIEVRRVALLVAAQAPTPLVWTVYEELPYGPNDPGSRFHDEAFAAFAEAGFLLSELHPDLDPTMGTKAAAAECYTSQLGAMRRFNPNFDRDIETERYWSLHRPNQPGHRA